MSQQFVVGKQYKLAADSSLRSEALTDVLSRGLLVLPSSGVFTCHEVDIDGDCWTHTEGVVWRHDASANNENIMCATTEDLELGAFEEVAS